MGCEFLVCSQAAVSEHFTLVMRIAEPSEAIQPVVLVQLLFSTTLDLCPQPHQASTECTTRTFGSFIALSCQVLGPDENLYPHHCLL